MPLLDNYFCAHFDINLTMQSNSRVNSSKLHYSGVITCLLLILNSQAQFTSVRAEWMTNQTNHNESSKPAQYQNLIDQCLVNTTLNFEKCVSQFKHSLESNMKWLESEQCSQEESIRRFCCMQNELKECWTASMHSECSEQGARLTKWLPLQLLTHLRTDHRCSTYVLYPHKCRENFFSLWQILAYLLLIPFISFALIMGIIIVMSKLSVFK